MGATLRATRTAGIAGAALIAAAAVWSQAPVAPTVPSAAQDAQGDLIDRFLDLAEEVPELDPEDIVIGEFDREQAILGDLVGKHAQLERAHDSAQQLFIDGDEARNPVGDLVSLGARAVMLIEDGYRRLADYELVVPFLDVDELEVAVGTDDPRNLLLQGVDLLQEGHGRLELILVGLRDVEMTTEQASRYRAVVEQAVRHAVSVDPALRALARDVTSHELLNVDRFEADVAGTAKARWASYVCIPQGSAEALSLQALVTAITTSLAAGIADDCPDFPSSEILTPAEIEAGISNADRERAADEDSETP